MIQNLILAAITFVLMAATAWGGYQIADGKCAKKQVATDTHTFTNIGKADAARNEVQSGSFHGVIPERVRGFYID